MSKMKPGSEAQSHLAGFAAGAVVILDGGSRIRLDDKVDYWPATGEWRALVDRGSAPGDGAGMTSLLAFLQEERARAGTPVESPAPLRSEKRVTCTYCNRRAELHNGSAVHPGRKDLEQRLFWVCWTCDAWVGCHVDTDRPFGRLANEELRLARKSAHDVFDEVWKQGRLTRPDAYAWLSRAMKLRPEDCHIGMFTVEECQRAKQLVYEEFDLP